MERRKFFKSLGALGLAAIIPKFLLGKEEKNYILPEVAPSGFSIIREHKDIIWDKSITMDQVIRPEGMDLKTWLYFFKTGVLYYDYSKCNIEPKDFKELILAGENTYVRHIDIGKTSNNPINISKLTIIDFKSNRWVDSRGYCNYTSVDRW